MGMIWGYFQKEKEVETRLKEEMSPFFMAAAVDETGAMSYHPYKEVFDMMDEVAKLREEISGEESEEGMQLKVTGKLDILHKK